MQIVRDAAAFLTRIVLDFEARGDQKSSLGFDVVIYNYTVYNEKYHGDASKRRRAMTNGSLSGKKHLEDVYARTPSAPA